MTRSLLILAAIAVVIAAIALAWPDPPDPAPAPTDDPAEAESDRAAGSAERDVIAIRADGASLVDPSDPYGFVLDASKLTPEQLDRTITLADGSRVWALNGCVDTDHLGWTANRTRSPIVRIVHGDKYDMYEHADGAKTTTYDVRMPDGSWRAAGIYMQPIDLEGKPLLHPERGERNRLPAGTAARPRHPSQR